jgi:hypothetical protein
MQQTPKKIKLRYEYEGLRGKIGLLPFPETALVRDVVERICNVLGQYIPELKGNNHTDLFLFLKKGSKEVLLADNYSLVHYNIKEADEFILRSMAIRDGGQENNKKKLGSVISQTNSNNKSLAEKVYGNRDDFRTKKNELKAKLKLMSLAKKLEYTPNPMFGTELAKMMQKLGAKVPEKLLPTYRSNGKQYPPSVQGFIQSWGYSSPKLFIVKDGKKTGEFVVFSPTLKQKYADNSGLFKIGEGTFDIYASLKEYNATFQFYMANPNMSILDGPSHDIQTMVRNLVRE